MMSDPVQIALIGAVASFAAGLLAALFSLVSVLLGRRNSKDLVSTKETIETLEKNTNSIKDALVKVTGEAEFAKGLKLGSTGTVESIAADVQEKAAHSAGMIKGAADEKNRAAAEKAAGESPKE